MTNKNDILRAQEFVKNHHDRLGALLEDSSAWPDEDLHHASLIVYLIQGNGWSSWCSDIVRRTLSGERLAHLLHSYFLANGKPHDWSIGYILSSLSSDQQEGCLRALNDFVRKAPEWSAAYLEVVDLIITHSTSPVAVSNFQATWEVLSQERRDDITARWYRVHLPKRGEDRSNDTLERLTADTDFPSTPVYLMRRKWIDAFIPGARAALWRAMSDACHEFAKEVTKLGGEREQVGSLLSTLVEGMRKKARLLHAALLGLGGVVGDLGVDRYIFKTSEENRWGPDFALVIVFDAPQAIRLARFVLFQAKLIQGTSIKVDVGQLRSLLHSSWHSSFYVGWKEGVVPFCVAAAQVDNVIRARRVTGKSSTSTNEPRVRWSDLVQYGDHLPDLIAERFLCGEVGDPLPEETTKTMADIAVHLSRELGPFRYGVLGLTVTIRGPSGIRTGTANPAPSVVIKGQTEEIYDGFADDEAER